MGNHLENLAINAMILVDDFIIINFSVMYIEYKISFLIIKSNLIIKIASPIYIGYRNIWN
jgi:hypothetical protein